MCDYNENLKKKAEEISRQLMDAKLDAQQAKLDAQQAKLYLDLSRQLMDAKIDAQHAKLDLEKAKMKELELEYSIIGLIPILKLNGLLNDLGIAPVPITGS